MKKIISALALAFALTAPAFAQPEFRLGKKEYMSICNIDKRGSLFLMTNGSASGDCDRTQSVGTVVNSCLCTNDGLGGFEWQVMATGEIDLSAYVPVTKAGNQAITSTGGDVTLNAAAGGINLNADQINPTASGFNGSFDSGFDVNVGGGNAEVSVSSGAVNMLGASLSVDAGSLGPNELDVTSGLVAMRGDIVMVNATAVPTTATDTCTLGTFRFDSSHLYYCHATNQWTRAAWAAW